MLSVFFKRIETKGKKIICKELRNFEIENPLIRYSQTKLGLKHKVKVFINLCLENRNTFNLLNNIFNLFLSLAIIFRGYRAEI